MKDSKLIAMLKTFTQAEMKEFEDFINSDYFSKGRDLSSFFKCLKTFYPDFEHKKFTAENVFAKLYPGKNFNQKTSNSVLYTLSSELLKLCKEYLIISGLNQDFHRRQYYLLNKLREKKLYKEFEKEYSQETSEDDQHKGGANDFLNKYYLTFSFLEYCVESGKSSDAVKSIFKLGDYSALVALIYGYRNQDISDSAKIYNMEAKNNFIDNLIEHLDSEMLLETMKKNNDGLYPYAAVNHAIYQMNKNPENEKLYFNLKILIEEYLHLFGHSEKYVLYGILGSYCVRKVQSGSMGKFLREEFEVHKKTVELGIYKYDTIDKINISRFRNIVGSAFDVNEIDWLENFVRDYADELEVVNIENMKHYSYAYIFFGRKKFDKALESLIKVKYDFFLFKMDVKHLMLKLYYELGYYDQAFSMLDTMKHYIAKTNDLSEEFKTREENFMKYVNKFLKEKTSASKIKNGLKETIEKDKTVSSKNWLLEKAGELEKS